MSKTKKIIILILYFISVILALGSIGVWLPLILGHYQEGTVERELLKDVPGNLITYSGVIFITCFIDRIIQLFKTNNYTNNTIEFLLLFVVLFGLAIFFTYKSLWFDRFNCVNESIWYAIYLTGLASLLWIYVKSRDKSFENYSALGGPM